MAYGSPSVPSHTAMPASAGFETLSGDLRRIFDRRLVSLVAYGEPGEDGAHTLALVERLTFSDLTKCGPMTSGWHRLGLATPLIMTSHEFERTLDVFPLEYGDILARHVVLAGSDPFTAAAVPETDIRRACERQAKSHLIHLREGFLETGGDAMAVARLIGASAPAFRTLLAHIERLDPGAVSRAGIPNDLVGEVASAGNTTIADPSALLARYVAAVERLWQYVDAWR